MGCLRGIGQTNNLEFLLPVFKQNILQSSLQFRRNFLRQVLSQDVRQVLPQEQLCVWSKTHNKIFGEHLGTALGDFGKTSVFLDMTFQRWSAQATDLQGKPPKLSTAGWKIIKSNFRFFRECILGSV